MFILDAPRQLFEIEFKNSLKSLVQFPNTSLKLREKQQQNTTFFFQAAKKSKPTLSNMIISTHLVHLD